MVRISALLAATGASLVSSLPVDPHNNPGASVVSVAYSGNGCPQGSSNNLVSNGEGLTFSFNNFNAELNSGNSGANCEVHLTINGNGVPGWQLRLSSVEVEGDLNESNDASVTINTNAFWSESAATTVSRLPRTASWSNVG